MSPRGSSRSAIFSSSSAKGVTEKFRVSELYVIQRLNCNNQYLPLILFYLKGGRTIEIRTPNHKHRYILERANEGTSIERPSSSGNDFSKKSAGKYRWLHIWPRMRKSSGSCFLSSGIGSSSPSIRGKSVLLCIIVLRNVVNLLHGTTTSISLMLAWLSAMHQMNAR